MVINFSERKSILRCCLAAVDDANLVDESKIYVYMNYIKGLQIAVFIFVCWFLTNCHNTDNTVHSTYKYMRPVYNDIQLITQADTLNFALSNNSYNEIKSFNYFIHNGKAFISFLDGRAQAVNIYDFSTRQRIKKIKLKRWLGDQPLYKTTVFVRNFDSIFVTNQTALYLFDSTGNLKNSIDFEKMKYVFFDNTHPIAFRDNMLYMGIRPYMSETSFSELRRWRLLYEIDLQHTKKHLSYSLPEIYHKNLYGYNFLDYSYCYNDKGNFVFSFPADTNIYETNLNDLHIAYYGKSRLQREDILPVSEEAIKSDKAYREFRLRDSYGSIYYDPIKKRYLRLARQKISETEFQEKTGVKKQSVIIFDEHFMVIGEPVLADDLSFSSLFFTGNGQMYVRVNSRDEYALHFVRLAYSEDHKDIKQLTKK